MATESNKSTKPGDADLKPKLVAVPKGMGYPNKGGGTPKKTRGNGAATKGTKAYGPMA
jgi:hypothetical protein